MERKRTAISRLAPISRAMVRQTQRGSPSAMVRTDYRRVPTPNMPPIVPAPAAAASM